MTKDHPDLPDDQDFSTGETPDLDQLRLRREAEKKTEKLEAGIIESLSAHEARRLLHDLQVHQIELKMQNEELRQTQAELEASRKRYFDLYTQAPVGYCTVSEKGLILEANLTYSNLLGFNRSTIIKQPISFFIFREDQDIYYFFRNQFFRTGQSQRCELRMKKKDGEPFGAGLEMAMAEDENGTRVCRLVISDISERKQAEAELHRYRERLEVLVKERTKELEEEIVERKRAEENLREAEDRLSSVLKGSQVGFWIGTLRRERSLEIRNGRKCSAIPFRNLKLRSSNGQTYIIRTTESGPGKPLWITWKVGRPSTGASTVCEQKPGRISGFWIRL